MAVDYAEVELLKPGTKAVTVADRRYVQNLFLKNGNLEVRPGFGQIAQLDTTLGLPPGAEKEYGYQNILASVAAKTNFGNVQIVTLVRNRAYTGNIQTRGQWATLYSVIIYDVTTRRHWEVALHRHTSEYQADVNPMDTWRAVYETSRDDDYQSWESSNSDVPVWMTEYRDTVFFGSSALGVWAYVPSDFNRRRRQQVDGILKRDFASPYGESSLVFRVVPQSGQFADTYGYLDTAGFPAPVDATVYRDRLVYGRGRDVYFSDQGVPNAIAGGNVLRVPSESEITALAEVNGSLLIFTDRETWLYRAPIAALLTGGELVKISDSIGCLGPAAKTRAEDLVVWADARGVYASQGLYKIEEASGDIADLFDSRLSSPLTSYYQADGHTDLTQAQPRTYLDWTKANRAGVNMTYDPLYGMVLVAVPNQNTVLCLQEGVWSIWSLESLVQPANDQVGVLQNLQNGRILAIENEVYLVGGTDPYTPVDETVAGRIGGELNENAISHSIYITQLGVGGALDRTCAPNQHEDNRVFQGYFEGAGDTSLTRFYKIGEPTLLPEGYLFPRNAQVGVGDKVYLFPIHLVPREDGTNVDNLHLTFDFDQAQWEPVLVGATTELDFILPPERHASRAGFGYGAPVNGTAEVQVYSNTLFVPQVGGGRITINWDGATGTAITPWSYGALMNVSPLNPNPVIYIAFKKLNPTTDTSMSLGITYVQGYTQLAGVAQILGLYWWHAPHVPDRRDDMDVAQPVDWCFKSEQVGLRGQEQVMARSLYSRLLSHGMGTAGIYANWIHGLFNASISSDWKDWASQILDYGGNISDQEKDSTLRLRMRDSTGELAERVFNAPGVTTGPTWGDSTDSTKGNFLCSDEEYDTISISDSVKGEHVSWMVYGHLRDPAERLVIDSLRAAIKAVAGRRRRGR